MTGHMTTVFFLEGEDRGSRIGDRGSRMESAGNWGWWQPPSAVFLIIYGSKEHKNEMATATVTGRSGTIIKNKTYLRCSSVTRTGPCIEQFVYPHCGEFTG